MKNYVGISRDHSGSMKRIAKAAARDYNQTIQGIKEAAHEEKIDTIVSVVKCGVRTDGYSAIVETESVNSSIAVLKPLAESAYKADGQSTPLFDSVGKLIEMMESVPDAKDPQVSFTVLVITDGIENDSHKWDKHSLSRKIKELQNTDRWSFLFRVPRGNKYDLMRALGIPEGNILEWDQTEQGIAASTVATTAGFRSFYSGMKSGKRSTGAFYTDIANVSTREIKATLDDISRQVSFWTVNTPEDGSSIRGFCNKHLGKDMLKGAAFYQLTKTESEVQEYKIIAIADKNTGAVYSGPAARDLLGLPTYGTVKVAPGDHGKYDIFIQSTSVNRKLPQGTRVMYWPNVGTAYKS